TVHFSPSFWGRRDILGRPSTRACHTVSRSWPTLQIPPRPVTTIRRLPLLLMICSARGSIFLGGRGDRMAAVGPSPAPSSPDLGHRRDYSPEWFLIKSIAWPTV